MVAHWSCPVPQMCEKEEVTAMRYVQREVGLVLGANKLEDGQPCGGDELLRAHAPRHDEREDNRADHRERNDGGVEAEGIAQLLREHVIDGVGEDGDLEDDAEEEDGREAEAARLGKVVVSGVPEGRGDADEQQVEE